MVFWSEWKVHTNSMISTNIPARNSNWQGIFFLANKHYVYGGGCILVSTHGNNIVCKFLFIKSIYWSRLDISLPAWVSNPHTEHWATSLNYSLSNNQIKKPINSWTDDNVDRFSKVTLGWARKAFILGGKKGTITVLVQWHWSLNQAKHLIYMWKFLYRKRTLKREI